MAALYDSAVCSGNMRAAPRWPTENGCGVKKEASLSSKHCMSVSLRAPGRMALTKNSGRGP
eukprot:scaffold149861_cov29-Tisochrysis_lutea.AAC.2